MTDDTPPYSYVSKALWKEYEAGVLRRYYYRDVLYIDASSLFYYSPLVCSKIKNKYFSNVLCSIAEDTNIFADGIEEQEVNELIADLVTCTSDSVELLLRYITDKVSYFIEKRWVEERNKEKVANKLYDYALFLYNELWEILKSYNIENVVISDVPTFKVKNDKFVKIYSVELVSQDLLGCTVFSYRSTDASYYTR